MIWFSANAVRINPAHMFFGDCKNCLNIGY
jgi:hypothetical protein